MLWKLSKTQIFAKKRTVNIGMMDPWKPQNIINPIPEPDLPFGEFEDKFCDQERSSELYLKCLETKLKVLRQLKDSNAGSQRASKAMIKNMEEVRQSYLLTCGSQCVDDPFYADIVQTDGAMYRLRRHLAPQSCELSAVEREALVEHDVLAQTYEQGEGSGAGEGEVRERGREDRKSVEGDAGDVEDKKNDV